MTVTTFADDDEALAIANGTDYGLGGGLWTRDLARGAPGAPRFRTGMVWVNCTKRVSPGSPFGGVGQSGYGREMGFEAMRGYTEPKSVWVNVDAAIPAWYPREPTWPGSPPSPRPSPSWCTTATPSPSRASRTSSRSPPGTRSSARGAPT